MSNVYHSEKYEDDNLLLMGQMSTVTEVIKAGNEVLERGCVVGLKTETGEAYPVDKTKDDGTQFPYAVIAESPIDQTPGGAVAYLMGEFNADALIVGSGVIDDYKQDMRKIGLIVRNVQRRF